jgi:hypothetical protein
MGARDIQNSISGFANTFHKQKLLMLVAASLGAFSSFLPWVSGIVTAIGVQGPDGWLSMGLFAPAIVLAVKAPRHLPMVGGERLAAVICAGLAGLVAFWKITSLNNPFVGIGIGLYLIVAMAVTIGIIGWTLETTPKPPSHR